MDIEKKKEIVIQKTRQELYEECGISQKRSINGSNRDDRSPSERVRFSSSFDILHHFWPYQEYRVPSAVIPALDNCFNAQRPQPLSPQR